MSRSMTIRMRSAARKPGRLATAIVALVVSALSGWNCGGSQSQPEPTGGASGGSGGSANAVVRDDVATGADDAASGSTEPADASTATASSDAAAPDHNLPAMPANLQGPPRPWAQMTFAQRDHHMDDHVLPAMEALLRAYDPQHFENVTCSTCHGRNARRVNFRMPNPQLPQLHPYGSPEARAAYQENPRVFHFMGDRIVPAMSQLLGIERWSAANPNGFGCARCHTYRTANAAAGADASAPR